MPDSAAVKTDECGETMSSTGEIEADLLKNDAMLIFGPDAEEMGQRAVAVMASRKLGGLLIYRTRLGTLEFPDVPVTGFILHFPHFIPSLRGGGKNEQQLRTWATQLLSGASYSAAVFGKPKLEWTGGAADDFVLLTITWQTGHSQDCLKLARAIEASFDRLAASNSTSEVSAMAREMSTPPAPGRKLSTSEVLALARGKRLPAGNSDSQTAPAWRQLMTDCPKCGHRFKWIDKGRIEETPFCPNCGYDAVYNGRRSSVDPAEPQPVILPAQPTGLVSCDKCGATNRSTGAPIELVVQFSLWRCQSCGRTFCTRENCVDWIEANMPCPHCEKISHFVAEDYDYV
jgi:hypothetical protein